MSSSESPYFIGPNAGYRNPPIEPQYFEPSIFPISNIMQGQATVVTFSTNHNYVIGQLIRFVIPTICGIRQINEQTAYVISIPAPNGIEVNLDSTQFDPFVPLSPPFTTTPPQVIAVGDVNFGLISSTGRVVPTTAIPGSFINISPN